MAQITFWETPNEELATVSTGGEFFEQYDIVDISGTKYIKWNKRIGLDDLFVGDVHFLKAREYPLPLYRGDLKK